MSKIYILGAIAAALLTGCVFKPKPAPITKTVHEIPVQGSKGMAIIGVREVCLAGVMYFVTDGGGIAAKINHDRTGPISAFVNCE